MLLIQATVHDNSDIYVMPADTGKPQRLTSDSSFHMTPSWSADGKWIYFSATPALTSGDKHRSQIWRIPAGGGPTTQITKDGGFDQQESFDGKFLFYLDRPRSSPSDPGDVMRIPVGEGDPVTILKAIPGELWSLTRKGMFYVTRDGKEDTINLLRLEDDTKAPVGTLPFRISASMTVSQDGRWLLCNQINRYETDLMLIENYK
jgi:hypothetical protein